MQRFNVCVVGSKDVECDCRLDLISSAEGDLRRRGYRTLPRVYEPCALAFRAPLRVRRIRARRLRAGGLTMVLEIQERGWIGHFICADRCRFRRNTLLTFGDVRVVVSTVGAMGSMEPGQGFDTVGSDRHFETRAFMASFESPYWDADVTCHVSFASPWSMKGVDRHSDAKANAMHDAVVAEIAAAMQSGTFVAPEIEA